MLLVLLQNYPVSVEYIHKRYKHFSSDEWGSLSRNYKIKWTEDLVSEFEDYWCWYSFSCNPSLPWSKEFYEKYKHKLDDHRLSYIEVLPWTGRIIPIDEYVELENSDKHTNQGNVVKISPTHLDVFKDVVKRIGYSAISKVTYIGWTEEILDEFTYNWNNLSQNPALPWSESLIEKYSSKWDWGGLALNKSLPWSKAILEKYSDKFHILDLASNSGLAKNGIFFKLETILDDPNTERFRPYHQRIAPRDTPSYYEYFSLWSYLSSCPSLIWSVGLIDKYFDRWDWEKISGNKSIPWSKELIEKYKNKFDWTELSNTLVDLEMTELIEYYENKIDWEYVSSNPKITHNILKKFAHRWDWRELAFFNEGVIWTDDIIDFCMKNYYLIKKKMIPIEYKNIF